MGIGSGELEAIGLHPNMEPDGTHHQSLTLAPVSPA